MVTPVIIIAALVAIALVIVGGSLCIQYYRRGVPWQPRMITLIAAFWCGNLLAMGVGLWWWSRARANPTGRLLYAAGVSYCLWMIGQCWPYSEWATLLVLSSEFTVPLLAMVVLGWPTGRPSRRIRRIVIVVAAGALTLGFIGQVFDKMPNPSAQWPQAPYRLFSAPVVGHILDPIAALCFVAVPATAAAIWLVRRQRGVPPAVRPFIAPMTFVGVLGAGSLVVVVVGLQLFDSLLKDGGSDVGVVAFAVVIADFLRPGIVAVGVAIAGGRRRRAVALGDRHILVDLQSATPIVSPSAAAAAIVGDPSATVRYRGPDGDWIDATGVVQADLPPDRRLIPVHDGAGGTIAGVDVSADVSVPPLLADLVVSTVALRAANERAAALADARRTEVAARSRELVAATDRGRVNLERDLHDGAQQLLVGLALTVGLRARDTESSIAGQQEPVAAEVIRQVERVRAEVLDLVDSTVPAALTGGLASAIRSLMVTSPVPVALVVSGDIPPDDPLALDLYLAAGELLTNAVKHSSATSISVGMSIDDDLVRLSFRDNGIGGIASLPPSISDRVDKLGGDGRVDSPIGVGTLIEIVVRRSTSLGDRS